MIRIHVWISGHVQGVGFRASLFREVSRFPQIVGYVCNLEDGRVEALFQGPESDVKTLVAWCQQGPSHAHVEQVDTQTERVGSEWTSFQVRRSP